MPPGYARAMPTPATIDLSTWARRDQYALYRACADPFYELSFRVPVGELVARSKLAGWSPFAVVLAAVSAAANGLAPFRQRQRGDTVVEHAVVHPSWVVLAPDGRMAFARGTLYADLADQLAHIRDLTRQVRDAPSLSEPHGRDDLIYASSLAPLDLVSVGPERSGEPDDSVPRFFWGRVVDGQLTFTVCANHCFIDGMHIAAFARDVELAIARPLPAS